MNDDDVVSEVLLHYSPQAVIHTMLVSALAQDGLLSLPDHRVSVFRFEGTRLQC